jgi:pimeloyl-ACP methyl ester carboxylesterase
VPTARSSDGCAIHWVEEGSGKPILLVHGFASTLKRNWLETGWTQALSRAGCRVLAYDLRGHGESEKRYEPDDYAPSLLVDDALAVLDAAGSPRAVVMGYSMGARITLEIAATRADRALALILSGIGKNFRDFGGEAGDRDIVARALEAADPSTFPKYARFFRDFADQTHQDVRALAACWRRPIRGVTSDELAAIALPTLVTAGDRDIVAGDPGPIGDVIPGRNHMNAVGAREHRTAVLAFLAKLAD